VVAELVASLSLSGLPAARTSAAAMAFVLEDMHKTGQRWIIQ
jgi:hypothetical protein